VLRLEKDVVNAIRYVEMDECVLYVKQIRVISNVKDKVLEVVGVIRTPFSVEGI
jgi:hypothetical protein